MSLEIGGGPPGWAKIRDNSLTQSTLLVGPGANGRRDVEDYSNVQGVSCPLDG